MAGITPPRYTTEGMKILATLPDGDFTKVASALSQIADYTARSRAAVELGQLTDGVLNKEDLDRIVLAVSGLAMGPYTLGQDTGEFVSGVITNIRSSKSFSELQSDQVETLKERLVVILSMPNVRLSGKALDLASDWSHILQDAKILTDVRPIFREAPDEDPEALFICHVLKIDYSEAGDRHEFFATLDENDIAELRTWCDRAIDRSQTVRKLASKVSIQVLDMAE